MAVKSLPLPFGVASALQFHLSMEKFKSLIIVLGVAYGISAAAVQDLNLPADDAATTGDDTDRRGTMSYRNDGRLDASDARSLFSGTLPGFSHLDDFYRRGRGNSSCRSDWRRLRGLPVSRRAVSVPFRTFQRNADRAGLSDSKLRRIMATFLANQNQIPNQNYISVIDFDKASTRKRMFIINLRTGAITSHKVAHGSGSGPLGGTPSRFSNSGGTHASSLGCSLATFNTDARGRRLKDGHGRHKLMFQGLEGSNDQMCNRAVFMHPASYVANGGRSHGCPAVTPSDKANIYDKISNGGLVCAYKDGPSQNTTQRVRAKH